MTQNKTKEDIMHRLEKQQLEYVNNAQKSNRIALLTYGGSYAYGTNVEGSDVDVRGIMLPSKNEILSMTCSEEALVDTNTDTVIYPLKQMVKLLCNANPNTIEIVATREQDIFILSEEGQILRENVNLFLTKGKVYNSFLGYAQNQLRRLKNTIARDELSQSEKEQHILQSVQKRMATFEQSYSPISEGGIKLHIEKSNRKDLDTEIMIDMSLKNYPLRDTKKMLDEMAITLKQYGKLNHRNKKKDEPHLLKHSMHLARLYLMGIDILQGKGIRTYREGVRELLLDIRNGKYSYEEIYNMAENLEEKFKDVLYESSLPEKLDRDKINNLMIDINTKMLEG